MDWESGFPWKKIHDFLLDAGSTQSQEKFDFWVVSNLPNLIPADFPCALLLYAAGSKLPLAVKGEVELVKRYNAYYRYRMPFSSEYLDMHSYVDWAVMPSNEFYTDFLKPLGIRYILTSKVGYLPHLLRSTSSLPFTEQECCVYQTVVSHLANFYSYHRKISRLSQEAVHRAELAYDCRILSKREAEIVRLMALRMTAREIASILLISPRTVERHMANAYEKLGVDNRADLLIRLRIDNQQDNT